MSKPQMKSGAKKKFIADPDAPTQGAKSFNFDWFTPELLRH